LLENLGDMVPFSHFTLHYGVESEEIAYYDGYKRWQTRKISGMWIIYNRRLRQVSYHPFLVFSGSLEWAAERGCRYEVMATYHPQGKPTINPTAQ
jgi:hypothetical protein